MVGTNNVSVVELNGTVLFDLAAAWADRIVARKYGDAIKAGDVPLTVPPSPRSLVLVHFDDVMTSEAVEAWAKENGYEPAFIEDVLAVGSCPEYWELQRQFPIVTLGSSAVILGKRLVPYLRGNGSVRNLYLYWCEDVWDARFRFLLRKA